MRGLFATDLYSRFFLTPREGEEVNASTKIQEVILPRDGTGTYNAPESPAVTATPITASGFNATISDIGSALTQSLSRDGQTQPSANLPMNTFRHTNVGNAAARNEYATLGQVQNGAALWGGTTGGTANALTISLTPAITAYAAGQRFTFRSGAAANTSTATLSVNGLSALALNRGDGTVGLAAGDIPANSVVSVVHDGTRFVLLDVASTATAPATPVGTLGAVGEWTAIGASGVALVLPAAGTWAYYAALYNGSAFVNRVSGVAAGGATVGAGTPGLDWLGFAWRIA